MALNWCRLTDLNRYPFAYKATALPLELSRLIWWNPMESNHLLIFFRHPREPSTPEFHNWVVTVRIQLAFWLLCLNGPLPHSCHKPSQRLLQVQSGSGLSRMSFSVSCSTSQPKSPDRIAGIKKPKALTSGLNSLCVDNRSYGDDIRFT